MTRARIITAFLIACAMAHAAAAAPASRPASKPSAPSAATQPILAVSPDTPSVVFVCIAGGAMLPVMDDFKPVLRAGVESLNPKQKFNVIVLTQDDQLDMLAKETVAATPENVKKCVEHIKPMTARGTSNTEIGLRAALQQHPAIIYLVAASADDSTKATSLAIAKKLNANRRTKINTLALGDEPTNDRLMRALADASGGTYRAVTNQELRAGWLDQSAQPATPPAVKPAKVKSK
jgi:ABC-type sugar transport system substrate-binding protein